MHIYMHINMQDGICLSDYDDIFFLDWAHEVPVVF